MRLNLGFALLLCGLVGLSAPAFAAEPYQLDPAHSQVGFKVRHMAVSTVRGDFKDFNIDLTVDEDNLAASSIDVRIAADSIFTDNEQRDNHLRSSDFLAVDEHPEIVFKSKSITAQGGGEFVATGDLTIRGVTKEVELPFSLGGPIADPWGNMRLGAEGGLTINRKDYGVSWSQLLDNGGLVVADNVDIEFGIEATRPTAQPEG